MDNLSDSDVASKDLDCALSKKAGKQQLKCTSDEIWKSKAVVVHKAHFPTLDSSRK